jgi:hypothetical protein
MADVQKQFEEFDEKIRLGRFEENETLREKRDIIRKKVDANLPDVFRHHNETVPDWTWCDQGSYDLGTAIKPPIECDYDIDQGLYFTLSTSTYPDPVVLKERVHEALDHHTDDVRIRRSCVTVQYTDKEDPLYHVDIAVFSDASENADRKHRLAIGRESSANDEREWRVSDVDGMKEKFWSRFASGPDRDQFRRIARYFKRWKDYNFSASGNAAPSGISLTVVSYDEMRVTFADSFTKDAPIDLDAMRGIVKRMLARFEDVWDSTLGRSVRRLKISLPVEPWNDLLARMTERQMDEFEEKLGLLRGALDEAAEEPDPVEACKKLRTVFGPDFPVPERKDTAKKHAAAVASSSHSA